MSLVDQEYLSHLYDLRMHGDVIQGRNGPVSTIFGHQMRFPNVGVHFPILQSKKVHFKSVLVELLWFLKGHTNVKYLHDHGVTIWDEWADENGELGPVYGSQWRKWPRLVKSGDWWEESIDQIKNVIEGLKKDPYGRRHIVTAWNPAQIDDMALPPCHMMFQFHVDSRKRLSCQLYQRSADWFLGVPFNIASYALLTIIIAREANLEVGDFVHTFGNTHLYHNHFDAADEQLSRWDIANNTPNDARVVMRAATGVRFDWLEPIHFELLNYDPLPTIRAPVSK